MSRSYGKPVGPAKGPEKSSKEGGGQQRRAYQDRTRKGREQGETGQAYVETSDRNLVGREKKRTMGAKLMRTNNRTRIEDDDRVRADPSKDKAPMVPEKQKQGQSK